MRPEFRPRWRGRGQAGGFLSVLGLFEVVDSSAVVGGPGRPVAALQVGGELLAFSGRSP